MPIGTISNEATRFALKSAPANPAITGDEDGYIIARPLPYGMKLERRDKSTRMRLEQQIENKKKSQARQAAGEAETRTIEIESESAWAAQFDFGYCIVDHNLTDPNHNKLDFSNPMAFKSLDPKIGTEIEEILAELNGDNIDEADLEDFIGTSTSTFAADPDTSAGVPTA